MFDNIVLIGTTCAGGGLLMASVTIFFLEGQKKVQNCAICAALGIIFLVQGYQQHRIMQPVPDSENTSTKLEEDLAELKGEIVHLRSQTDANTLLVLDCHQQQNETLGE